MTLTEKVSAVVSNREKVAKNLADIDAILARLNATLNDEAPAVLPKSNGHGGYRHASPTIQDRRQRILTAIRFAPLHQWQIRDKTGIKAGDVSNDLFVLRKAKMVEHTQGGWKAR